MRIAVVGVGGVGGYFGARLAQSGQEVVFVARGAHLEAMRTTGLDVESPEGNLHLSSVTATDNPTKVGCVDAVLVAVKTWQLSEAIETIRPLLRTDTAVVPLLNGVDAPAILSAALKPENVLGGLCGIVAHISGPGRIKHAGAEPFIQVGELDNSLSPRVQQLRDAFDQSGVRAEIPEDIEVAIWQKFLFIAPTSGVGAVTRATFGVIRQMPETLALVQRAMRETLEVGQASGVTLTVKQMDIALHLLETAPANGTTSMQRDIAAGRPSELDAQTGAIVRTGERHGISTPVNDVLYRCLLPQERRARGEIEF